MAYRRGVLFEKRRPLMVAGVLLEETRAGQVVLISLANAQSQWAAFLAPRRPRPCGLTRADILQSPGGPPSSIARAGVADEIAHAAVYLTSDEAKFVNGEALVIDGGLIGCVAGNAQFRLNWKECCDAH